ncbi:MAG: Abi family protein [Mycoplasmatales bacterium]|nr:Abi family protein [Mycoplasmatales bacterium]
MLNTEKIRKRLIHEGLKETEHIQDFFLINKHVTRHLETLRFMKSNNLKLTSFALSRLYRADVVIRKQIVDVLMPIELSIVTKLQYWLSHNHVDFQAVKSASIFEDLNVINPRARWKARKNHEFVIESVVKISGKWNTNDMEEIVFHMTFGQVSAFIRSLPRDAVDKILKLPKGTAIDSLDYVVSIRNYIFHLGQLFIKDDLKIKPHISLKLKDLVIHINNIAYGDYNDALSKDIRRYEENIMSKNNFTESEQKQLRELFLVINTKMFGV